MPKLICALCGLLALGGIAIGTPPAHAQTVLYDKSRIPACRAR
jgi:hypothetical protein